MAKVSNDILTPTTRDMSEEQIEADRASVRAWLLKHSPVIIDSTGAWHRGGVMIKKADLPQMETASLWDWK